MQVYKVLGLMSGTSLDGLDLAYCEFAKSNSWSFRLGACATYPYPAVLAELLTKSTTLSGLELTMLDHQLGDFMGLCVEKFLNQHTQLKVDFIASHGHTIFHQPEKKFTLQIGNPYKIQQHTGLAVVSDFRQADVQAGGQGAPLVPIGDQLLFSEYDYCLNLGGFANISYENADARIAFDICPFNIVNNLYAQQMGYAYDDQGKLAREGKCIEALGRSLDQLSFYGNLRPKSLGTEWLAENFQPVLDKYRKENPKDILHTLALHQAKQIAKIINKPKSRVLVTGGGAYNTFIIETLQNLLSVDQQIIIPDANLLEFKEALIFAFLGVLSLRNECNSLSSVTGATHDTLGGSWTRHFSFDR